MITLITAIISIAHAGICVAMGDYGAACGLLGAGLLLLSNYFNYVHVTTKEMDK